MSGTFVIRAASEADAAAIAAVCTRASRVAYADLVTGDYLDRMIAHFYGTDRMRQEIAPSPGWFGFVVAVDGEEVVGVAGTGQSAQHPEACELFALYVDPAAQRRGIGQRLVAQAVAACETAGAHRLDVAVLPGNLPAIRFYEACGFTVAGERAIYAPFGPHGGPEVALIYTRHL
ncbi:Mycothiol acetyltransferase [Luteitalea pratensis]|uniref:Mycothiol acetyltransferase n=1 Tax=Luteitalea pratensis TaxID=1855912 RepID=A0A143PGH5_LUTPR|nr:GNAT family N-acetyltransferase [Luteitalea pratensis]AMY07526.1 Mycothiol acetyltransferase [Luteitalea pratensis]